MGATPRAVIGLVLRQGLAVVIIGTVIGLLTSLALMKYLSTLLYGVSSYDWVTFTAVSITISILALVACIVPAVRAARIDPLITMRA